MGKLTEVFVGRSIIYKWFMIQMIASNHVLNRTNKPTTEGWFIQLIKMVILGLVYLLEFTTLTKIMNVWRGFTKRIK